MRPASPARAMFAGLLAMLGGCCTTCGGEGGPRAGGDTPYVRCSAADEPAPRSLPAGRGTLQIEARTVRLSGAPPPYRVAVFRGPAPAPVGLQAALDEVESMSADLMLVMGGLGDDEASMQRNLDELASRELPVLVLLGGRDARADLLAALEELAHAERIVDLSGVRRLELGAVLLPVPGAPEGRYARSDESCGLGAADADEIANALGEAGDETRLLLSWAAPSGSALAAGLEGGDAGSPIVAALARRVGARGGLYAFPETQIGRVSGAGATFEWVVPNVTGGSALRADGSAARAGPVLMLVSADGIAPAER